MSMHDTLLLYLHSTPERKETLMDSEKLHYSCDFKLQVLGTVANQKNEFKSDNIVSVKESKNRGTK